MNKLTVIAKNKKFLNLCLFLLILLMLKTDYRLKEIGPGGVQDDSAYYYHVQTLVVDNDLDYTNQLNGNLSDAFIRNDGKPVPKQSFGPALLNYPFLLISNLISEYIRDSSNISLNYFVYSFISYFYLFFTIFLLIKALNQKRFTDKTLLLTFILGSGLSYYAFERFSMRTVYEAFGTALIIFISKKIIENGNLSFKNFYVVILPIVQFIMLINSWNNFHYFLIPILIFKINSKKILPMLKNLYFYIGNIVGVILFLIHTKILYGIYTFSQSSIWPLTDNTLLGQRVTTFLDTQLITENFIRAFKFFLLTCFSFEFGIFYFSCIIFSSLYFLTFYAYKKNLFIFSILIIIYAIPFLPILVFENHGLSYGFRYLFSLIPLNIYLFFKEFRLHKVLIIYLLIFSVFGIIAQLFFETSQYSSLSETTILNSFDSLSPYTNPDMLVGILKSMVLPTSYLKIVFTSFFGVIIIKFFSIFFSFIEFASQFYIMDNKTINLVEYAVNLSWTRIFLVILLIYFSLKKVLFLSTK